MASLTARLLDRRAWARDVAIATAMVLFFAVIGPFGSYAEPLSRRISECLLFGFGGLVIWGPGFRTLVWLADRWGWPMLAGRAVAALAVTAPVALAARLASAALWPSPQRAPFGIVYLDVAVIAVPAALASGLIQQRLAAAAARGDPEGPPRLAARLPAAIEAPILALEAEDHYVRVHTLRGSTLLLMRLSDAIAELDGLPGLRAHRSWWVARTAVAGAQRSGRRAELVLANGLVVPVARAVMAQARAGGYLAVRA